MAIDYDKLRRIALNIPEIQKLLIERREIEQRSKEKSTYTHLKPRLTPSNEKFLSKKHTIDKSKIAEVQKQAKGELKKNAHKIEIALYQELKKRDLEERKEHFKEMKATELVTFIEKGRDQVVKDRKAEKQREKQPKTLEQSQHDFNKKIERAKTQTPINHSQDRMTKKIEDQKEKQRRTNDRLDQVHRQIQKEYEENKRNIEQNRDRGFSR